MDHKNYDGFQVLHYWKNLRIIALETKADYFPIHSTSNYSTGIMFKESC